ncbi:MAG: MBL fold metallo-hydrolase [Geobacteraceae bacterium]|nr:MBL fold metallo-hydrolase [Geobacteraceae bacterium]
MEVRIQRGSHEIGGTCIRISSGDTTILIDAGLPLSVDSAPLCPSDLVADAVVISHPHQDHCGLVETLPNNTPVYIGRVAKYLLEATRTFLRRPPLANEFRYITSWQPFSIGSITITPYLVDHSATDSYAFLIEADDKKLFYSGDFRGHGRKSALYDNIIKKPPVGIDAMLMEGTMLGRSNSAFPTERSVEKAIGTILAEQKNITFLISSSQNIDRIVSAYRACKRTGKILVIDIYTAWVLEQMKHVSNNVPNIDWKLVKVAFDPKRAATLRAPENRKMFGSFYDRANGNRVSGSELSTNPHLYLMLLKVPACLFMKRFANPDSPFTVIYSQWQGYLENSADKHSNNRAESFLRSIKDGKVAGAAFTYAHTSGHATLNDLKRFTFAINPKRLIPIHTEHAHQYSNHFKNVVELSDSESFLLDKE